MRSFDWIRANIRDKDGQSFSAIDYPWVEGICDAWDDPSIRTVWLQFAARLGKSLLSQALMICAVRHDPAPAMIASTNQEIIKQTIRTKMWPMLRNSGDGCRQLCPAPHKQGSLEMRLVTSTIYAGWSGSTTSLADKDPRYKWGYEVDKWDRSSSNEADSLSLFRERGIEDVDRKEILESTPDLAATSRVNRGLLASDNRRFHIPCPLCGAGTQLIRGEPDTIERTGGVLWDKPNGGANVFTTAYETARYLCPHCKREWGEKHRRAAIRKGKWVPEGCKLEDGKVTGEPLYRGPDAGFQLGRLYASQFTFGDHARHWMQVHCGMEDEQDHINSWDGETWSRLASDQSWEQLGDKLAIPDHALGMVPAECSFLTMGVDVQIDRWVYVVAGWSTVTLDVSSTGRRTAAPRGYVIEYGNAWSWSELRDLIDKTYNHEDGKAPLQIMQTLVDARDGNRKDEIVDHCRALNGVRGGQFVWPCMGTHAGYMSGKALRVDVIGSDNKTELGTARGFGMVMLSSKAWQAWMQRCIDRRKPERAHSLALPREAAGDQDYLEQLLNVAENEKGEFEKVDEAKPVDFRDATRYSRCAAETYVDANWAPVPEARTWTAPPAKTPKSPERPPSSSGRTRGKKWITRGRGKGLRG